MSSVDFVAALREHGVSHNTRTQDDCESAHSDSNPPPNRLKKKNHAANVVAPSQLQDYAPHTQAVANPVVNKSPWACYSELYSLQFGDGAYFPIGERNRVQPEENPLCIVKRFHGADAEKTIQSIQCIRHQQFVQVREVFLAQDEFFVAFEFMPVSLAEIAGNPLINDLRLASVLGQLVDCILYLEENSLGLQLTCSNILMDTLGNVKLWANNFIQDRFSFNETIKSLAMITMKLIQGYAKEDGRIGLDMPERCPLGFDFLSTLEQMSSMKDLIKHRPLQLPWHQKKLVGLVSLVHIWSDRGFKLHPRKREHVT